MHSSCGGHRDGNLVSGRILLKPRERELATQLIAGKSGPQKRILYNARDIEHEQ